MSQESDEQGTPEAAQSIAEAQEDMRAGRFSAWKLVAASYLRSLYSVKICNEHCAVCGCTTSQVIFTRELDVIVLCEAGRHLVFWKTHQEALVEELDRRKREADGQ